MHTDVAVHRPGARSAWTMEGVQGTVAHTAGRVRTEQEVLPGWRGASQEKTAMEILRPDEFPPFIHQPQSYRSRKDSP